MESAELLTFATRVLERALEKAGYMPEPPADPAAVPSPGDVFVDNLAARLIEFVMRADAGALQALQASSAPPALDQLRERNSRFSRAVGACDCFGEDVLCTRCGGSGAPGWRLPDRSHFEAIVRPALQKVTHFRLSARSGRLHSLQR